MIERILLTNDDGVTAAGLVTLANFLKSKYEVFVVAPDNERSGVSQSITFRRPIFHKSVQVTDGVRGFAINGYPVDCVKVALFELCPFQPDLVVSGINHGLNVGLNVLHSGTVAGALTGVAYGIPSIALSLEAPDGQEDLDFETAVSLVWPICQSLCSNTDLSGTVLNVNIPEAAVTTRCADYHVVPVNCNNMGFHFEQGHDPKRRPYHWQTNHPDPMPLSKLCDVQVIQQGKIAISPIGNDLTRHGLVEALAQRASPSAVTNHRALSR
ncbi:MAG TPA: 5'/3'-nucleotidase SurE [Pirellulaceae bacterium]|nr:5'/3'-nucleotidase SurE [Pirellulaceae bacterium]